MPGNQRGAGAHSRCVPSKTEIELLRSIYPVSRETIEKLTRYCQLLNQWQIKTNLVAPSTIPDFWSRHVADSLQLLRHSKGARKWTDLGSGGGFPGMVIAIVLGTERPDDDLRITLVESIQKKCAFLRQVAMETSTRVEILPKRIEHVGAALERSEIISGRALASLDKLFELTEGHLCLGMTGLFHKGREFKSEIEECHGKWKFDLIVHDSIIGPDSVVLEVTNVQRESGS